MFRRCRLGVDLFKLSRVRQTPSNSSPLPAPNRDDMVNLENPATTDNRSTDASIHPKNPYACLDTNHPGFSQQPISRSDAVLWSTHDASMTIMCDKNSFILAAIIVVRSRRINPILWTGRTSLSRALESACTAIEYLDLTPRDQVVANAAVPLSSASVMSSAVETSLIIC